MLGFGVVVGSTVAPGIASLLPRALIVVLGGSAHPAPQVVNTTSGGGGGGGGGGGSSSGGTTTTTSNTPAATTTTPTTTTPSWTPGVDLPPAKHVFLIMLGDQGYAQTFGSTTDKYFGTTLKKHGELIPGYYGDTAGDLANEIGLISGQGPDPQFAAQCQKYTHFTSTGTGKFGQLLGGGCVYPAKTETIASQLKAKQDTWKAYIDGMNDTSKRSQQACRHPSIGATDPYQSPTAKDPYVTWKDPFLYFRGLLGSDCKQHNAGLTQLATDLKSVSTTPNFSYIAASPCNDGSDQPCHRGAPAGIARAEKFLKPLLAEIEKSPAYKADGLIIVTFTEAPQTGPHADTSSCSACDPQKYPNLPAAPTPTTTTTTTTAPTTTTTSSASTTTTTPVAGLLPTTTTSTTTTQTPPPATPGGTTTTTTTTSTTTTTTTPPSLGGPSPGGGQLGLLLISQYVKPNSLDTLDYFDHFALLGSLEQLFKLKLLGYGRDINLAKFTGSIFNPTGP